MNLLAFALSGPALDGSHSSSITYFVSLLLAFEVLRCTFQHHCEKSSNFRIVHPDRNATAPYPRFHLEDTFAHVHDSTGGDLLLLAAKVGDPFFCFHLMHFPTFQIFRGFAFPLRRFIINLAHRSAMAFGICT